MNGNDLVSIPRHIAERLANDLKVVGLPNAAKLLREVSEQDAIPEGEVVVTRNEEGEIVAVTRQNEDYQILSVIASTCHTGIESDWITELRKEALRGAMKDIYWLSRDQVFELIGDGIMWPIRSAGKSSTNASVMADTLLNSGSPVIAEPSVMESSVLGDGVTAVVCLRGDLYASGNFIEVQLQIVPGTELPIGTKFYTHPAPDENAEIAKLKAELRNGYEIVDEFLQCSRVNRPGGTLYNHAKDWLAAVYPEDSRKEDSVNYDDTIARLGEMHGLCTYVDDKPLWFNGDPTRFVNDVLVVVLASRL